MSTVRYIAAGLLIAVAVGALVTFIVRWAESQNVDYWERVNESGTCYIHVSQDRRLWFGASRHEERTTYCQEAAR